MLEEVGVLGNIHRPAASHLQTLSHIVVSSTPRQSGIGTHKDSGDRHCLQLVDLYLLLQFHRFRKTMMLFIIRN